MQVFACPLRNDSAEVLKELKGASHDLVHTLLFFRDQECLYGCFIAFFQMMSINIPVSSTMMLVSLADATAIDFSNTNFQAIILQYILICLLLK